MYFTLYLKICFYPQNRDSYMALRGTVRLAIGVLYMYFTSAGTSH